MSISKQLLLLFVGMFFLRMASGASVCAKMANSESAQKFSIDCPAGCQNEVNYLVWGIDIYTIDSSICRAAIHAGVITDTGGQVFVKKNGGQDGFPGGTRNGITSVDYVWYWNAFVVSDSPIA